MGSGDPHGQAPRLYPHPHRDTVEDTLPDTRLSSDALETMETLMVAAPSETRRKRSGRRATKDTQGTRTNTAQWAQALLDHLADGFLVVDATECLAYVNAAVERLLGRKRTELLGRNAWSVLPEAIGLPLFWHFHHMLAEGAPQRLEAYYPPCAIWLEMRLSPLAGGGVSAYIGDISERKRLEDESARVLERERAAHDSERAAWTHARELETILDAMADGVLVYDVEGRVIRVNDAAITLLGLREHHTRFATPISERETGLVMMHDLAGHPLTREQWPPLRVLRGEVLTSGNTVDVRAHTPDGRDLILNVSGAPIRDASGSVVGAVCLCRDITGRWRLERDLAERAGQIESVFEAMKDGVALCDEHGRLMRANRAFNVILGLDRASGAAQSFSASRLEERVRRLAIRDVSGQPLRPDQMPSQRALRGEVLEGARAQDMRIRTLDGRELDIEVNAAPVRDHTGRISGAVMVFHDVTERRRMEQQRTDIVRTVAHDIVNPLTAVRLYVQSQQRRLREGKSPFVPNETVLTNMRHGFIRVERLVSDLRAATSIEMGTLQLERVLCDLADVCRREAEVQQAVTGREIRLTLPARPVMLLADSGRLGQVVANLLANAIKYSPAEQPVVLALRREAGRVRVTVRDVGPGIPRAERQRIWEQFHRVPGIESQDGTGGLGLGLYISKAIVERHGGEINVKSVVGKGSAFWFTLPTTPAET